MKIENEYPNKFYRELAQWLTRWLIDNVGSLSNKLPYDIDLKMVVAIIIKVFYSHVKTIYRRSPLQETAQIFEISVDTISRAIRKVFE